MSGGEGMVEGIAHPLDAVQGLTFEVGNRSQRSRKADLFKEMNQKGMKQKTNCQKKGIGIPNP